MTRWEYLANCVVQMVPTWFTREADYVVGDTLVPGLEDEYIYSLHPPSDRDVALLDKAEALISEEQIYYNIKQSHQSRDAGPPRTDDLLGISTQDVPEVPHEKTPNALEVEVFTRKLAIFWLNRFDETVEWQKLLDYLDSLRHRTYENDAVSVTIVVDPRSDVAGSQDVTADKHQKILDMAAVSPETFIRVDRKIRFVNYEEAFPDHSSGHFKFAPDFATAVWNDAGEECYVALKTRRGDVLIMRPGYGLIASWRQGKWHLYDRGALQSIFKTVFAQSGSAILDLVFDLSYRRHGALLIYDPDKNVVPKRISNKECRIQGSKREKGTPYALLGTGVEDMDISSLERENQKRRLFIELASMDGALVFDDNGIRAFGAMVKSHGKLQNVKGGARTHAMYSARKHGSFPVKVSADGDVQLLFPDHNPGDLDIEVVFA